MESTTIIHKIPVRLRGALSCGATGGSDSLTPISSTSGEDVNCVEGGTTSLHGSLVSSLDWDSVVKAIGDSSIEEKSRLAKTSLANA
jgi:hypothetical protein